MVDADEKWIRSLIVCIAQRVEVGLSPVIACRPGRKGALHELAERTRDYWGLADEAIRLVIPVITAPQSCGITIKHDIVAVADIRQDVPGIGDVVVAFFGEGDDWIGGHEPGWGDNAGGRIRVAEEAYAATEGIEGDDIAGERVVRTHVREANRSVDHTGRIPPYLFQ
jgi:hypothetical protein